MLYNFDYQVAKPTEIGGEFLCLKCQCENANVTSYNNYILYSL